MSVGVVVPTYNEAENLGRLAEEVLALGPDYHMICVDDDSPDGTGAIADRISAHDSRFQVLHRVKVKRGYAPSSLEGLLAALDSRHELVATMDADLSHDPASLPALVERTRSEAALVVGSRYIRGGALDVAWGPVRRGVSRMGSAYARRMLGVPVNDCTSGFRCYRRDAVEAVLAAGIDSDGYVFLIEALSAVASAGLPIAEEPITYVDRKRGESKISRRIVAEALWRTTALGVRRVTGRVQAPGSPTPEDAGLP